MSDTKKILEQKQSEVAKAGRLLLDAFCGDTRAVAKKVAIEVARERGRADVADVIDAEFDEGDEQ